MELLVTGRSLRLFYVVCLFLGTVITTSLEGANWTQPTDLSNSWGNTTGAQVFVDSGKRAVAVWSEFDGSCYRILSATRTAPGVWSGPLKVSTGGGSSFFPQVVVDGHGNATAIWAKKKNNNFVIETAVKPYGKAWSMPVSISEKGQLLESALFPQILLDANGLAYAVWQRFNGTRNMIQFATRNEEGVWSAPTDLSAPGVAGMGDIDPRIAVGESGDIMVIWCNANRLAVQVVERGENGRWTRPMEISKHGHTVSDAQVGVDKAGNATAVWSGSDGRNMVVQTVSKPAGGSWSSPECLSEPGHDATVPSFSMNGDGHGVAVWQRFDGDNSVIQVTTLIGENQWKPVTDLTATGEDASDPKVAVGTTPQAVIVWKKRNYDNFIIQSSKTTKGQQWSAPFTITDAEEDSVAPQVAINEWGNCVTVFENKNCFFSVVQASSKALME